MLRWQFYGASDVGRKRSKNEDAWGYDDGLGLFIVADGMGGHAAGEQASQIAVQEVLTFIQKAQADPDITWPGSAADTDEWKEHVLRWAFLKAHQRILETAGTHAEWQGMATTAVVVQLDPERRRAFIAHVGDSRAYLIRQGKIIQLTQDHSWVNEQIKVGIITAEEARVHPFRNVVTRALGGPQDPVVDIDEEPLEPDDIILLCTDGLSGVVSDEDILATVTRYGTDLEGAAQALIQQANANGGPDNITVVLVRIVADANSAVRQ